MPRFYFILFLVSGLLTSKSFSYNLSNKLASDTTIVISGLIYHGETGKAWANAEITISFFLEFGKIDRETVIKTDKDGFYFLIAKKGIKHQYMGDYHLTRKGVSYGMTINCYQRNIAQSTAIHFIYQGKSTTSKTGLAYNGHLGYSSLHYVRPDSSFSDITNSESMKRVVLEKAKGPRRENELVIKFKKLYSSKPKQLITKVDEAFFSKDGDLIGYEGHINFYLDGEKSDFTLINGVFYQRKPAERHFRRDSTDRITDIYFYSAALDAEIPPNNLMTPTNFEWVNPQNIDLDSLTQAPCYVDGYWQVNGWGTNKIPAKNQIKRIALLKGRLARHYNFRFDKVWWIETKAPDKVWARPVFGDL